jgi:hypothetical protein
MNRAILRLPLRAEGGLLEGDLYLTINLSLQGILWITKCGYSYASFSEGYCLRNASLGDFNVPTSKAVLTQT